MSRRLHVHSLMPGPVELDEAQRHHAHRVLRLAAGDEVELFDDQGQTAIGTVAFDESGLLHVTAGDVFRPSEHLHLVVASAVPKGDRADWMVEKLSEVGCSVFIPLLTDRSVVEPKGTTKLDRWKRLATESAKQCRRPGVMRIESPTAFADALTAAMTRGPVWFFDTVAPVIPVSTLLTQACPDALSLFVGPEGGWSPAETDRMRSTGCVATGLTDTVLRVETAAVTAAAIVRTFWSGSIA